MKAAIPLLSVALLLSGCDREKGKAGGSRIPVGTWACKRDFDNGSHFESKTIVASDGRYVCHIINRRPDNTYIYLTNALEGTMEIRGGFLVDTITKTCQTNVSLPIACSNQIIRISDRELVVRSPEQGDEVVFKRVK